MKDAVHSRFKPI